MNDQRFICSWTERPRELFERAKLTTSRSQGRNTYAPMYCISLFWSSWFGRSLCLFFPKPSIPRESKNHLRAQPPLSLGWLCSIVLNATRSAPHPRRAKNKICYAYKTFLLSWECFFVVAYKTDNRFEEIRNIKKSCVRHIVLTAWDLCLQFISFVEEVCRLNNPR